MTEPTVEAIFGVNAGIVWEALNKNGPSIIGDIVKATGLRRELVYGALGWLGRESKITIERRGRAMVFSLREAEALQKPFKGTTIAESAPHEQTKHRTRVPPKKTTHARKVKSQKATNARKVKAPLKQSERIDEFLLH
jgi:hypothetical protein